MRRPRTPTGMTRRAHLALEDNGGAAAAYRRCAKWMEGALRTRGRFGDLSDQARWPRCRRVVERSQDFLEPPFSVEPTFPSARVSVRNEPSTSPACTVGCASVFVGRRGADGSGMDGQDGQEGWSAWVRLQGRGHYRVGVPLDHTASCLRSSSWMTRRSRHQVVQLFWFVLIFDTPTQMLNGGYNPDWMRLQRPIDPLKQASPMSWCRPSSPSAKSKHKCACLRPTVGQSAEIARDETSS